MAVDYGQVRSAFIEAWARAVPGRLLTETRIYTEKEWDALAFPTWWTWMCESADTFVFWVGRDDGPGRELAASTWKRLEFCQIRTANTEARHALAMVAELGIGNYPWTDALGMSFAGPAVDQAREIVARLAARVLDELAAELDMGE